MLNTLNACRKNKEKCDFPNEYANLNNDLILVEQRSYNFPSKVIAFDDMQEEKKAFKNFLFTWLSYPE